MNERTIKLSDATWSVIDSLAKMNEQTDSELIESLIKRVGAFENVRLSVGRLEGDFVGGNQRRTHDLTFNCQSIDITVDGNTLSELVVDGRPLKLLLEEGASDND